MKRGRALVMQVCLALCFILLCMAIWGVPVASREVGIVGVGALCCLGWLRVNGRRP